MILIYFTRKILVDIAVLPFKNTVEGATGNQILQITSSWLRINIEIWFSTVPTPSKYG